MSKNTRCIECKTAPRFSGYTRCQKCYNAQARAKYRRRKAAAQASMNADHIAASSKKVVCSPATDTIAVITTMQMSQLKCAPGTPKFERLMALYRQDGYTIEVLETNPVSG